jgi:hypothetical protein
MSDALPVPPVSEAKPHIIARITGPHYLHDGVFQENEIDRHYCKAQLKIQQLLRDLKRKFHLSKSIGHFSRDPKFRCKNA